MYVLISVIIFIIHALFIPVYIYLTWHHKYWQKRGLITARPITLLGTYPSLITGSHNFIFDIQKIYDKYKGKYRAVGVFVTRLPQILVLDPELAHEVLVKDFSCFRDSLTSSFVQQNKLDKYVRRNPFWAAGDYWKAQRQDSQGGLTSNRLKQGYTIWLHKAEQLHDYIKEHIKSKGNIINTKDLCYRFTAAVSLDFVFGIEANTLKQANERSEIFEMTSKWSTHAFNMLNVFLATTIAPIMRRLLGLRFYLKDTDEFFAQLTKESLALRQQAKNLDRNDYLSYLLQLREKKQLSHDDLVGHALTVLLDGFETTAAALMHTLYYLAQSIEAQEKLRCEILSNVVETDKNISFEALNNLPYLEQCIYESLRLTSFLPHLSKICTKATTIEWSENKTLHVEPGVQIMLPAYQFHYDSDYFQEPKQFKPERFDNGQHNELIKQGKLLPFGDGPRTCMGSRLSLLTMKVALVRIISTYEVLSTEAIKLDESGFSITLAGDVKLEYKKLEET